MEEKAPSFEQRKRKTSRVHIPPPPSDPFFESRKLAYDADWVLRETREYLEARRVAERKKDELDTFLLNHPDPLLANIRNRLVSTFEKELGEERRKKKPPSKRSAAPEARMEEEAATGS